MGTLEIGDTLGDAGELARIVFPEILEELLEATIVHAPVHLLVFPTELRQLHRDATAIPLVAMSRDKALLLERLQRLRRRTWSAVSALGDIARSDALTVGHKLGNRHQNEALGRRDALRQRRVRPAFVHAPRGRKEPLFQFLDGLVHAANLLLIYLFHSKYFSSGNISRLKHYARNTWFAASFHQTCATLPKRPARRKPCRSKRKQKQTP